MKKEQASHICPYCRKSKETKGLCFVRSPNGDNVSPCSIFSYRQNDIPHAKTRMGIPKKLQECTLANFEGDDIKEYIQELVSSIRPKIYVFTGSFGVGKTHLAVSVMYRLSLEDHRSVKFRSLFDIMSEIYAALSEQDPKAVSGIVSRYSNHGVLCIDDLGTNNATEYQIGILYQIINNRYEAGNITIVTTNLSGTEIAEKFDGRIASRLGSGQIIKINSTEDYRKRSSGVKEFDV